MNARKLIIILALGVWYFLYVEGRATEDLTEYWYHSLYTEEELKEEPGWNKHGETTKTGVTSDDGRGDPKRRMIRSVTHDTEEDEPDMAVKVARFLFGHYEY